MGRPEAKAGALRRAWAPSELPVPVEQIARALGVQVVGKILADDVSGLLIRPEAGPPAIVINKGHPRVRQRFTIAHELGHLILHRGRPLVVDHVRLNLRDARSRAAVDVEEIEANAFAAELLMPRSLIVAELNRAAARTDAARLAGDLAEGFGVSKEAAEYRLVNLGISGQV